MLNYLVISTLVIIKHNNKSKIGVDMESIPYILRAKVLLFLGINKYFIKNKG